ncbi:polyubiquitin 8-like [Fagus crenata]
MLSDLSDPTLEVTFEPQNGSDPFNITVSFNDSLLEIKEKIKRSQNLPISMQTLIYNGHVLQDDFNVLNSGLHLMYSRIQLVIAPESDEAAGIVENSSMNVPLEMDVIDTECLDEKIQEMEANGFEEGVQAWEALNKDEGKDKNLMHVPVDDNTQEVKAFINGDHNIHQSDEAPAGLVKNTMHVPLEKYGNDTDEGLKETIQEREVYNIQELEAGIDKFLQEIAAIPVNNSLMIHSSGIELQDHGSSFGDFNDSLLDNSLTPTPPASEAELPPPFGPPMAVSPALFDLSNPLWSPPYWPSDARLAPPPGPSNEVSGPLSGYFGPPNAVSTPHFDLSTTASAPLFGGFGPSSSKPALFAPWSGPSNTVSAPLFGPSNARMGPPSRLTKEILPPPTGSSRSVPNKLKVMVETRCGKRFEVEVQSKDKVEVLRKKIEKLQGELDFSLPEDGSYFFIHGQDTMEEDKPFWWHRVSEGDTICIFPGYITRDSASITPRRRF